VTSNRSVDQILRVDHAGERGAICIYQSQLLVARLLHPQCVPALVEMLGHERRHFQTFDRMLRARRIRHCHALALWAFGGAVLGFATALLGVRAIWVCTAAIENTVNEHLLHQVDYLSETDAEALAAVQSIRRDEQAHEEHALDHGGASHGIYIPLHWLVRNTTAFAIWLSTKL